MSSPVSSAAGSSTAIGAAVQQVQDNTDLNQQAFLQLLSTQLSNQDPTAPQDESQMLAQLAQFSTVQGVNQMAASQSQLQASGLLGKTVSALANSNNNPTPISGPVTSVRWDGNGTYLTINDPTAGSTEVNLTAVTNVSN
jgi:flagellar basal-body rod modification protein FlgD